MFEPRVAQVGTDEALRMLRHLLTDPDAKASLRVDVAKHLSQRCLDAKAAHGVLLQAADARDANVREAVAEALEAIKGQLRYMARARISGK